jgi:ATP/maltotriose-dependent transcriptional regulator MalT
MSGLLQAFAAAASLEAKDPREAARLLDEALAADAESPAPLRFRALVVRADLACTLGDLIESRGILAEARQVRLDAQGKREASGEIDRADALETFLTHRGCAG